MISDIFRFKQFDVRNSASAQKVGTDGVLLAAWTSLPCDTPSGASVLDVGTGTGVIALILAQRCPGAHVIGIDIDEPSVEEAAGNFARSPFAGRLEAVVSPVQDYSSGPFDLIVSNPPFFSGSLKAPDCRRNAARHTDSLSYGDLVSSALRLMAPGGRLAVVYPPLEAASFTMEAESGGLFLLRRCEVRSMPSKPVRRVLSEFGRTRCRPVFETLCIQDGPSSFSAEYSSLVKDFYLR